MPKKKKTSNTGNRLTAQQKSAIAGAGEDVTNVALAEKYGTTGATIAKYRNGGASAAKPQAEGAAPTITAKKRGRPALTTAPAAAGASGKSGKGVTVEFDGGYVMIRAPKSNALVKGLVNQLMS